jgi:RNA polymerase sigma-70 factor (ECF subfamily)
VSTVDLVSLARAGDGSAFEALTEPFLRELHVHCYRMLGSLQDAEDVLQDTLLAAWQGLDGYAGRASLRTWLYQIATNRCLNARRSAARRPAKAWDIPQVVPPEPSRLGEVAWLEPLPDAVVGGAVPTPEPAARYEQTESISLAFITALQLLPARQVAALILCDAVGFEAPEVAEILGTTRQSVHSLLKRARATMRQHESADHEPAPAACSIVERETVAAFARAYEAGDLDGLVALLTDDVFMSMPPMALEYVGRDAVRRFCGILFGAGRRYVLTPTRANGQPAFASYVLDGEGVPRATGIFVLTLAGDRISALTRFEVEHVGRFGLPMSLLPKTSTDRSSSTDAWPEASATATTTDYECS